MSKSYVNEEHRNWLYANYANKSNEELASLLTEMVREENEKEVQHLKGQLEFVTQPGLRKRIEETIRWRESFTALSPRFVGRLARRLEAPKKNVRVVSESNRARLFPTNIKRWEKQAQTVKEPFAWLRSFYVNEVRIVRISSQKEKKRVQDAITNYNRTESIRTGLVIASEHVKGTSFLRVVALPK